MIKSYLCIMRSSITLLWEGWLFFTSNAGGVSCGDMMRQPALFGKFGNNIMSSTSTSSHLLGVFQFRSGMSKRRMTKMTGHCSGPTQSGVGHLLWSGPWWRDCYDNKNSSRRRIKTASAKSFISKEGQIWIDWAGWLAPSTHCLASVLPLSPAHGN